MYQYLPWIALALAVCAAALWKPIPRSQARFRAAIGFLVLWFALWAGTAVASYWPVSLDLARHVALALVELAAVQVIAGVLFDFAVEKTGVPRFAAEMVVVICYVVICFNLFISLGVNVTGIFATSAVATAVIGLALQDMLGNIASGIALEFENDIQVGDFIRVGDAAGWVQHVRLRHTAIETPDGDRILLPNSFLTRSAVSLVPPSRRQFIPFNMPYARNPQEMIDAVTDALRSSPLKNVAPEPAPFCIILEMTPGHIRYAAVVWMLLPGREAPTTSAVLNRIYFSLKRAGIALSEISNLLEMMPEDQPRGEHHARGYSAPHTHLSPALGFRSVRTGRLPAPSLFRPGRTHHPPGRRRRFHVFRHRGNRRHHLSERRPIRAPGGAHGRGRFFR